MISRGINHLVNSPRLFCSSPFYSRYHITIKTYFYIINIHKCFHNRGGVFHFQIIGDRFVIASIPFLHSIHFSSFIQYFFRLSKCTSIPAIIYILNYLVRIRTVQNNLIICTAVFSWVKKIWIQLNYEKFPPIKKSSWSAEYSQTNVSFSESNLSEFCSNRNPSRGLWWNK